MAFTRTHHKGTIPHLIDVVVVWHEDGRLPDLCKKLEHSAVTLL